MIDHTGLAVSDFETSKAFYSAALQPIGYELLMEFPAAVTGHSDVAGFGEPPEGGLLDQSRESEQAGVAHRIPGEPPRSRRCLL